MTDELLLSIAFPGDTREKILQDWEQYELKVSDGDILIRKSIEFCLDFSRQLVAFSSEARQSFNQLLGCNLNLIKPKVLAEFLFNEETLDAILDFLKRYDNSYFWNAFGISLEKGNSFYEKMNSYNNESDIFSEIHSEIMNSEKLNKEVIINELMSYILFRYKPNDDFNEFFSEFLFTLNEVSSKYPSVDEALCMTETDEYGWAKIDCLSIKQKIELLPEDILKISPILLFELIKWADNFGSFTRNSCMIHTFLESEDTIKSILLNAFKTHRCGYEAYQIYLVWCKVRKIEPALKIGNSPELYFYNSYKVPQIESLYKGYFSELSEEEAKEKTKECFEEIYNSLKNKGFLDEGCRKEEFLWAFGLTEEYPFAFKKIKFNTLTGKSKKSKGNGAFLCLLTILGYTPEEIKAMLHRNPEKSIINKTFDLTIKNNTIISKDYDALLKIVKSSGLPI